MSTPYEKIYSNLLPKFHSYEMLEMPAEEIEDYLHDFLLSATVKFHVCRQDLSDRDDELQQFNIDLTDLEIEILTNYLLLEYLDSTYIRTALLLKANLSSSDFNSFSPANLLDKLLDMHDIYLSENEGLLSKYAWFGMRNKNINESTKFNNTDYKKIIGKR